MPKTQLRWEYTIEEWLAHGDELFGPDKNDWKFVCPTCRDVTSIPDFIDIAPGFVHRSGPDQLEAYESWAMKKAGQECIGRSLGALKRQQPRGGYKGRGCNWVAYGLFRGPVIITLPVTGEARAAGLTTREVGCFHFAEPDGQCWGKTARGRRCSRNATWQDMDTPYLQFCREHARGDVEKVAA